jgi:hypothetical protein
MTQHYSLHQLRLVAETLAQLHGSVVHDAVMRSDLRQLKIELVDGTVVLVAVTADEAGQPRLEVDVVQTARAAGPQLEVRFDSA